MVNRVCRRFMRLLFASGVAAALLGGGAAFADDKDDIRSLKEQLELQKQQMNEQKKQLEELKKQLTHSNEPTTTKPGADAGNDLPPPPPPDAVRDIVIDVLNRRDEAKEAA